ncbi:MAG: ribose-phosphate pyrophosphokinase, partial [Alphaproteobacteria bacterium]|nr:ribose-phosphate pyrophosphokinase [Alphaproteobacteria bacterium]
NVIIYDDMIRSGSSVINAAKAYKEAGAKNIYVVCVHCVFSGDAHDKLKENNLIKNVYCTNTHSCCQNMQDDFVKVYDISEIILDGLRI